MTKVAKNQFNSPKRKWYDIVISVIIGIAFMFTIAFLIFSIIFVRVDVIGVSMQPTYNSKLQEGLSREQYEDSKYQDKVYVNRFGKAKRGDIIVAKVKEQTSKGVKEVKVIKRLVALGGDSVDIKLESDGIYYLFVNDKKVEEKYIKNASNMAHCYENFVDYKTSKGLELDKPLKLAEDQIFILGDNRGQYSLDSSTYGPISEKKIVGKVAFSVPYNSNFISYYIFGIGR